MDITCTLTDDVRTKQLVWYDNVQRIGDERLPKQILRWTKTGRRKGGKPRISWREGVDTEICYILSVKIMYNHHS